jgi:CHASE3 domain sensor protein
VLAVSLRRWVGALAALGMAVLVVVGVFTFGSYTAATQAGDAALNQLSPAAQAASRLNVGIASMDRGVTSYLRTEQASSLEPYVEGANSSATAIEGLRVSLAGVGPGLESRVEDCAQARNLWISTVAEPVIRGVRNGNMEQARATYGQAQSQFTFQLLRSQTGALEAAVDVELNEEFTALRDSATFLGLALVFAAAALVIGLVFGIVVLQTGVLKPLSKLRRQLRDVATKGHRESPIIGSGPPEFREAATDAENMRAQLVAQIDEASRANESLATEAPDISAMRAELTRPSHVHAAGLTIFGVQQSAQGVLAGDWWDVVSLDDGRSALIVTDISGHGPAAGFAGIRLKLRLTGVLSAGGSALTAIEGGCELFADYDALFATVALVILDPIHQRVEWINAGHPAPLIIGPTGTPRELEVTGPLLSTLGGNWRSESIEFAPGELVVVCTDGITESHDGDGSQLDQDGLSSLIAQAKTAGIWAPAEVVAHVLAAARDRATDWDRDDVTLVVAALNEPPD